MPATMTELAANTADFLFTIADGDTNDLRVTAFSGTEGLNQLFQFRVELMSADANVDLTAMVGRPCLLQIVHEAGRRYVHGIVRAFQRLREGSHSTHYAAEIVPLQWLLTRRHGCRIFQEHNCKDMTVPGIVAKVLKDAGIPQDRVRFAMQRDYTPRDYVVQYRETELDFIARLMEEEGIGYFFEHTPDGHMMVISDSNVAFTTVGDANGGGSAEYPFRTPSGLVPEHEHVFMVSDRAEVPFGTVTLDDFSFLQPGFDLNSTQSAADFTALEFRDYPGNFDDKEKGQGRVTTRLEEFQCARRALEMSAAVRALVPGYKFSLIEHPADALNREYIVTQVTHRARQAESGEDQVEESDGTIYEAQARVIPSDVTFRPPRVTPRPVVQGTQTAIVVGPEDEEIYTDQYGRVKVQFHWDREGKYTECSSCWIRVSQGWAGGKYGMIFLPRVGHEVIVDFLEGNPDCPIITGRVYNNDLMPVFDLPDTKYKSGIRSQSTKGGDGANALIFDDQKGEERIRLHGERDLELTAENDVLAFAGQHWNTLIEKDRYELVKGYHELEIRLDCDEKVLGNKSLIVKGSVAESFGSHSESAGSYYLTTDKGEVVIESAAAITLKVGGNFVKIHGGGIDIMGTVVNINSGGSAGNGTGGPFGEFIGPDEPGIVHHGYDVSYYAGNGDCPCDESASAGEDSGEPAAKLPTTWIEIELVDEAGQAWPNEPYEITTPESKVYRGTLDEKGQAHVEVETAGECQISFPKLDMDAWMRA